MDARYNVVFYGTIVAGFEKEEAKRNLAFLLKLNSEKIELFFSGRRIIVKNDLPHEKAQEYMRRFMEKGALCKIEKIEDKSQAERYPSSSPYSGNNAEQKITDKDEITCPKCNFIQEKTETCIKCGIIISKHHKKPPKSRPPFRATASPKAAKYELKELRVVEIIKASIYILADQWKLFFFIFLYAGLGMALAVGLALVGVFFMGVSKGAPHFNFLGMAIIFVAICIYFIIGLLMNGAVLAALSRIYIGLHTTAGDSFSYAYKRLGGQILTLILVIIITLLSSLGILIPILDLIDSKLLMVLLLIVSTLAPFYFLYIYFLAGHVAVIEGISGFAALSRSRFLMKGNFFKMLILGALLTSIQIAISIVLPLVDTGLFSIVTQLATSILLTAFYIIGWGLFYLSSRCQHETFNLSILARSVL